LSAFCDDFRISTTMLSASVLSLGPMFWVPSSLLCFTDQVHCTTFQNILLSWVVRQKCRCSFWMKLVLDSNIPFVSAYKLQICPSMYIRILQHRILVEVIAKCDRKILSSQNRSTMYWSSRRHIKTLRWSIFLDCWTNGAHNYNLTMPPRWLTRLSPEKLKWSWKSLCLSRFRLFFIHATTTIKPTTAIAAQILNIITVLSIDSGFSLAFTDARFPYTSGDTPEVDGIVEAREMRGVAGGW
jgi:hypothetical protein